VLIESPPTRCPRIGRRYQSCAPHLQESGRAIYRCGGPNVFATRSCQRPLEPAPMFVVLFGHQGAYGMVRAVLICSCAISVTSGHIGGGGRSATAAMSARRRGPINAWLSCPQGAFETLNNCASYAQRRQPPPSRLGRAIAPIRLSGGCALFPTARITLTMASTTPDEQRWHNDTPCQSRTARKGLQKFLNSHEKTCSNICNNLGDTKSLLSSLHHPTHRALHRFTEQAANGPGSELDPFFGRLETLRP